MGLRPLGATAVPLWFGSLVHEALAAWYLPGLKRGPHPAETFERLAGDEIQYMKVSNSLGNGAEMITEETLVDAHALGIKMLEGYVDHWGKDERWRVIKPEQTFQMDVADPRSKKGRLIGIFAGTYDLVYIDEADGTVWLGEHKTAKAIRTGHLPLDPQAGGYWTVATDHLRRERLIKKGQSLRGIQYNFLRKAFPDERPRNADGYACNKPTKAHYWAALDAADPRSNWTGSKHTIAEMEAFASENGIIVFGDVSKNQPKPLFEREKVYRTASERAMQIHRMQNEFIRMEPLRRGEIEPLKHPTMDCEWRCPHYQMCLLHEQGGDYESYMDAAYEVRDPYADHRKTTEGDD